MNSIALAARRFPYRTRSVLTPSVRLPRGLNAVVWLIAASAALAQSPDYFLVAKGQVLSQFSSAAPPIPMGAGLDIETPAFGGPPIVTGGSVTLPGGVGQPLILSPDGTAFQFTDTASSVAALDTLYPVGQYALSLQSTFISGLSATIS